MKFKKFDSIEKDSFFITSMSNKFHLNPKIVEIMVDRGYNTEEKISDYINIDNTKFLDAYDLNGMDLLVDRIKESIKNKEKVLIFGDYDVDGISATFVMIKIYKYFGVDVDYYLPNRFIDGYGLTNEVIDKIQKLYNPSLIITVDCGISCHDEIEYAKTKGIEIVVTDHHNIPDVIPETIVVDPKIVNQKYQFNDLCGAGVAFKVSQTLLPEKEYEKLLPIVAIATIADIVSLTSENRLIVKKGLELSQKYLPIGIKSMFTENKITLSNPSSVDIAFKIAPKLNASGRMGDASDSLKLYLETDIRKAKALIEKINNHNIKRQSICASVYDDCKKMLEKYNTSKLRAIILYSANWDQGILGIVCSKLLEEYRRPVFLFSKIGNELKGSARSIDEINIHHMLSSMQDILTTFGGHSVAAGLTLDIVNFDEFSKRINAYILENINDEIFSPTKYYDADIDINDINSDFVEQLKLFEPCGCNNTKPLFKVDSENVQVYPLKSSPKHANINISKKIYAIFFNYVNNSIMLKLCKHHSFILEFQDFKNGMLKANVKNYNCDFVLKDKVNSYVDKLKLSELAYVSDKTECNYISYSNNILPTLVAECNHSAFGTCFISYSLDTYINFINNYDLSKIYDFKFCNCNNSTGFNTIFLFPEDLSFTKNYNNIIFLDSVIDTSIINYINSNKTANVYLPVTNEFSRNIFDKLSINRTDFAKMYSVFLKLENCIFSNVFDLYSYIFNKIKFKVPFNCFYFELLVFKELGIINFEEDGGLFKLLIKKKNKRNLSESKAYNFVLLINKLND